MARQAALLTALVAAINGATAVRTIAAAAVAAAAYAALVVLNDLLDLETDRRNGRDLPLVTGAVSVADALLVAGGALVVILAAQPFLAQPAGILLPASGLAAGTIYSLLRRGLTSVLVLAGCYVGGPILLGLSQAGITPRPQEATSVAGLVLIATAVVLYKDVRDIGGDTATGRCPPLARLGLCRMQWLAVALAAIGTTALGLTPSALAGMAVVGILVVLAVTKQESGPLLRLARFAVLAAVVTGGAWL